MKNNKRQSKICFNCEHWGEREKYPYLRDWLFLAQYSVEETAECAILRSLFDFELKDYGWDGYSELDKVCTPYTFGCNEFKKRV